jgi:hypothetical protein
VPTDGVALCALQVGERLGFCATMLLAVQILMIVVSDLLPTCGELLWIELLNLVNFIFCFLNLIWSCGIVHVTYRGVGKVRDQSSHSARTPTTSSTQHSLPGVHCVWYRCEKASRKSSTRTRAMCSQPSTLSSWAPSTALTSTTAIGRTASSRVGRWGSNWRPLMRAYESRARAVFVGLDGTTISFRSTVVTAPLAVLGVTVAYCGVGRAKKLRMQGWA